MEFSIGGMLYNMNSDFISWKTETSIQVHAVPYKILLEVENILCAAFIEELDIYCVEFCAHLSDFDRWSTQKLLLSFYRFF